MPQDWLRQIEALASLSMGCGGYVVALAVVCLLQYLWSVFRQRRLSQRIERYHQELDALEQEVKRLKRDRTVCRLENQLLHDLMNHSDFFAGLDALLRRFITNPADGWAAFAHQISEPGLDPQCRGLTKESVGRLVIDDSLRDRLKLTPVVALEGLELHRTKLFSQLQPADRKKTAGLYLARVGAADSMCSIFVTTSLLPIGAPISEQFELVERMAASLEGTLRQSLMIQRQSSQLRCSREMLELRAITDAKFDQPVKMIERFVTRLGQLVGAERGALFLVSRDTQMTPRAFLRCGLQLQAGIAAAWQAHEEALATTGTLYNQLTMLDQEQLQRCGIGTLIGSAFTAPVIHQGRTVGMLVFTRRISLPFDGAHRQLVSWAADTLSQTIQRVANIASIERQARQDGLTELANRRTFDSQLTYELERIQRGDQTECSLLMLDLDRFKSINDTYGHQAGDFVLKETAHLLREQVGHIRSSDRAFLARYGGEELAVLLPGIGINGALRIAETIRASIEAHEYRYEAISIPVTASLGVATCPLQAITATDLINAADGGLYQAKQEGRNCVRGAKDTPLDPVLSTGNSTLNRTDIARRRPR